MSRTTESVDHRFAEFRRRMVSSGVASWSDLVGCNDDEIVQLESKYRVKLPRSYRLFLRAMGHESGRLFKHDHLSANFGSVLDMTNQQAEFWQGVRGSQERVLLPPDTLIIMTRMGEVYFCIRCAGGEDTPVLYYNETAFALKQSHESVIEWLETWLQEAEDAIESGYFDQFPDGSL